MKSGNVGQVARALALLLGVAMPAASAHALAISPQSVCEVLNTAVIPASDISLPTTGATITGAVFVKATDGGNTNGEYCRVVGLIHPVDPEAPEIRFQVNLPGAWNGKALQFGGGGYNGSVPNTLSWAPLGRRDTRTPLAQGYMTFASDSGHQAPNNSDASFALNDEALLNFGYMHIRKTRDVAYAIAQRRYGRAPQRMYFAGGSTGGREALTAAMRWPDAYDGVISNYPTANFMGLRLWGAALARAIYDDNSEGWIPPALVQRIAAEALKSCDVLDGIADGLVSNMAACRAQSRALLAKLACTKGETGHPAHCLTQAQIGRTINVYHEGFRLPYAFVNGVDSYPGYNSLEGIIMQTGSQPGLLEPPKSGPNAHHVDRAAQFMKYFVTRDPAFKLAGFDIQNPGSWKERIVQLSDILGATTPDWETFRRRGGKVLWVQGNDDPSVSPYANLDVYKSIVAKMGQAAVDSFMRFYLVPGLAHGDGKFLLSWDNLAILDDWVDRGVAPPLAPVGVDMNAATKGRSRPVCAYPTWPKYKGSGSPDSASSYECTR